MAQQVALIRVKVPSSSPFIDDSAQDWVIEQTGSNANLTTSTAFAKISNFYTVVGTGGTRAAGTYFDPVYTRATNGCSMSMYDITANLNGTPHGSPIAVSSFTLPSAASPTPLPEGCCCLIGFRSDYGTDVEFLGGTGEGHRGGTRPRSRDRGRIYFGGLNALCVAAEGTTNRCILASGFITDMTKSLIDLQAHGGTSDIPTWVQWSRRGAKVATVNHVWLDDAPRYQRRKSDLANKVTVIA